MAAPLFAKRIIGPRGYQFSHIVFIDNTPIKNQQKTGTCWSFSTASFIESELMRLSGKEIDLSEMYFVRKNYEDKSLNYVLRQGKTQFSQGGLNHDVLSAISKYGMVPENAYPGNMIDSIHNHSEMEKLLFGIVTTAVENPNKKLSPVWKSTLKAALDGYLGIEPSSFTFEGKTYSPLSFVESLNFDVENYISFTSFNHEPFYENYILQVPDNWSNGAFMNVPLTDLMHIIDNALENGYTIAWDADVSEPTFSRKKGIAIMPKIAFQNMNATQRSNIFQEIQPEMNPSDELRLESFMNYSTTDDHLMHIVGKATDQQKNIYYIVKNSWGSQRANKGYVYVSASYMALKTIGIMLHKGGVPSDVVKQINR